MGQYLRHLPCFSMGYSPPWPALYWDPQTTVCFPEDPHLLLLLLPLPPLPSGKPHSMGPPRGSCKETQACIPERPRRRTPCCLLQNCLMSAAWSPTIKQTPALCSSKKLPFVIPCLVLLLHLLSFLLSHSFGTLWTPEARCSSHPCFLLSPKFGLPVQSFYLRIQCLPFL